MIKIIIESSDILGHRAVMTDRAGNTNGQLSPKWRKNRQTAINDAHRWKKAAAKGGLYDPDKINPIPVDEKTIRGLWGKPAWTPLNQGCRETLGSRSGTASP